MKTPDEMLEIALGCRVLYPNEYVEALREAIRQRNFYAAEFESALKERDEARTKLTEMQKVLDTVNQASEGWQKLYHEMNAKNYETSVKLRIAVVALEYYSCDDRAGPHSIAYLAREALKKIRDL